jgi:uncharacterized protein
VTAIPRSAPVAGSTALPGGFWHPHASEQARAIAEAGMILRVQVGSGVHGTAVAGQDDRDEMGLCLEPPEFVTGLARVPNGAGERGPAVRFEQYERHTAWDRPGGLANPSGAGDLDVVIYSARKWARLALAGNPTVLLVLFVPDHDVVFRNQAGAELTSRPELIAVHGYDTKYAMHALRLGLQGIELLTTGENHAACARTAPQLPARDPSRRGAPGRGGGRGRRRRDAHSQAPGREQPARRARPALGR